MQIPSSPHAMAIFSATSTLHLTPKLPLPQRGPSRPGACATAFRRPNCWPVRATTGEGDAATTTEKDRPKKERKRCLRCGALYLDEDNPPAACAFHGHITGTHHATSWKISSEPAAMRAMHRRFLKAQCRQLGSTARLHLKIERSSGPCRRPTPWRRWSFMLLLNVAHFWEWILMPVGAVAGEKGLFSLSPPHQGIDGEWSDKSGVIVYRWNDRGNRPRQLEGEVELLPGARQGGAAVPPWTSRLLRRWLHSLLATGPHLPHGTHEWWLPVILRTKFLCRNAPALVSICTMKSRRSREKIAYKHHGLKCSSENRGMGPLHRLGQWASLHSTRWRLNS
jgi:hypothetical protein